MTLLTCMQTSSTMSTCIININNDHDKDPASPPLPPRPPHLSSDDNNNNGRYPDHHNHPYQQHRQQQKGSRRDTSRVLRYVFFLYFSLFKFTTNEYIHFRLLTTTQRLPRHLCSDVAAVSDAIELRGTVRLEKWQGEGTGLET